MLMQKVPYGLMLQIHETLIQSEYRGRYFQTGILKTIMFEPLFGLMFIKEEEYIPSLKKLLKNIKDSKNQESIPCLVKTI